MPRTHPQDFLRALHPENRDESEASVFHHAMNVTAGVLVLERPHADATLVEACFRHGLPVGVEIVAHDPRSPRLEVGSREVVGAAAIRTYLEELR